MTRRGFLGPVLATVAAAACAPLTSGRGLDLGPAGWTEARLAYGSDPRQSLYIRRPKAFTQPVAGVLILGGSTPTKADEDLAAAIAAEGIVAIVVGRRASPIPAFPAYISDNAKALAWCVERADALALAVDRMGLLGLNSGALEAQILTADGRYLEAVGQKERVRAVAIAGPIPLPDATFTHPVAYRQRPGMTSVWQGEASAVSHALHYLKQELSAGR